LGGRIADLRFTRQAGRHPMAGRFDQRSRFDSGVIAPCTIRPARGGREGLAADCGQVDWGRGVAWSALSVNRHGMGTPDRLAIGTPLRVRWEGAGVVDAEP